jgi:hypothetical protein
MASQDFLIERAEWISSDNVTKTSDNTYLTQCTQYRKEFNLDDLSIYFHNEYYAPQNPTS